MIGPDTKYKMLYMGEWRPVTNLIDASRMETTLVTRAVVAVLFIDQNAWVPVIVNPGDLVERFDRDPDARDWDAID